MSRETAAILVTLLLAACAPAERPTEPTSGTGLDTAALVKNFEITIRILGGLLSANRLRSRVSFFGGGCGRCVMTEKRHQALKWLNERPLDYRADRFAEPGSALAFVRSLHEAGAAGVDVIVQDGRDYANSMLLQLPADPQSRGRLFRILEREHQEFGEDFGADPNGLGGREMTREEAEDIGDPSLEGEWIEEYGPPCDVGQSELKLWWD